MLKIWLKISRNVQGTAHALTGQPMFIFSLKHHKKHTAYKSLTHSLPIVPIGCWILFQLCFKPRSYVSTVRRHVFLGLPRLRLPWGVQYNCAVFCDGFIFLSKDVAHPPPASLHNNSTHALLFAPQKNIFHFRHGPKNSLSCAPPCKS